MSKFSTYKGDLKINVDSDGDYGINIENGQPEMTEFLDTAVLLYVFGVDSVLNSFADKESEKMQSDFPDFLDSASVSDATISRGRIILLSALQPLIDEKVASEVIVDGEIISVYGIKWSISIIRLDNPDSKYSIYWDNGFFKFESGINGTY